MKHRTTTVASEPFGVSSCTGDGKCVATPTRHFKGTGKYTRCDLYGQEFKDSDAAHEAMLERGYAERHFPRRSTPNPAFGKLSGEANRCKFDALYRLYRWKVRNRVASYDLWLTLHMLAQGHFGHPASKQFLKGVNDV